MNETMQILFGLFGGLAIFIYGMNMMSECLQKAAGEKMKMILSMLTKNPVLGVLAGALTTAVLQSSSATTVMAIGFVSANLMTLPQAISIILGANIGTTMTAQIIAFKISDYIYLFVFAGFLVNFICKSEKVKNIGQTIFAFGLLFLGIETMGGVMKPLASSPIFTDMIAKVADIPVLGVCVGALMTLVVQSSSATIAVLQNFAAQAGPDGVTSIIGLAGAIPILLGDNIGTTITALLASVGQSKDAKRTAVAHCIFNLSGAFLFIWFVKPYASLIQRISPQGAEVDVISRQIANAHTGFNLVMTLIWIPLIAIMVKIVMLIIPDGKRKKEVDPSEPKFLDDKLINQPAAALHLAAKEAGRCTEIVEEMLLQFKDGNTQQAEDVLMENVKRSEIENKLNERITDYLSTLYAEGVLTEEQANQSMAMLYVLCDIDRIADFCREISNNVMAQGEKRKYSKDALKDLRETTPVILDMYEKAMKAIIKGEPISQKDIQERKERIVRLDEKLRKSHAQRVVDKKCDAKKTLAYNRVLHDINRMANSCVNLMEAAVSRVDFRVFEVEELN
ncbi:MAG: Na/Pi cotransporter family protein [Lachnospiraceae bacterium]